MCRSCFESFIRNGGTKTFVLNLGNRPPLEFKQDALSPADAAREWVDANWNQSFGATSQAILKTKPFEFSAAGLSDLDQDALRMEAAAEVTEAMTREGFTLEGSDGQQRALAVLFGFLNRVQQEAMGIDFYVWTTQNDKRVREGHAERDDKVFRWDDPPEGGHPSEDFGCRCYARPLGIEGYWERIMPSVDAFNFEVGMWEGNVDHMYLDTEGHVTVGKGKLLPNAESAAALPFILRGTDMRASDEEIRAEYEAIAGMQSDRGKVASYFQEFTTLTLSQSDIDNLVIKHMRSDLGSILRMFPDFSNYPLSAQNALWDMIYNLGPPTFRSEFPLLREAVKNGDWEEAAEQSHREGPREERNQFVFDLFMEAAEDS
jgi:GH24 family phage-related lysozyme (muramidase)